RHRIRLRALVFREWTVFAGHAEPPLGFAVVALELLPLERPVDREAVHRFQSEVFFREPVAHAAPVQRRTTDGLRARDDAARVLILHEIAGPLILAVVQTALPVLEAVLVVEPPLAGLDHDYLPRGPDLGELLGDHRGSDAAADDDDVRFVSRHGQRRA